MVSTSVVCELPKLERRVRFPYRALQLLIIIWVFEVNRRTDDFFYNFGKWVWIPIVIIGIFYSLWGYDNLIHPYAIFMCTFKRVTGHPCPGCGGSRAVAELFKGNILQSVKYNASVVVFVIEYVHFMLLCFIRKHVFKTYIEKKIHIEIYAYILAGVLILQWIVRLLLHISI